MDTEGQHKSERARRNCPNSELPGSNLDQFFVSTLGGAKKRLGASDLTRGLHGHSCLRVRVGTLELAKWDKSPTKLQITEGPQRLVPVGHPLRGYEMEPPGLRSRFYRDKFPSKAARGFLLRKCLFFNVLALIRPDSNLQSHRDKSPAKPQIM